MPRFQGREAIWSSGILRACKKGDKISATRRPIGRRFTGYRVRRYHVSSSGRVPVGKPARRNSQHAVAEEDVIQGQSDDRAYRGCAGAVDALEIEASQPATVK